MTTVVVWLMRPVRLIVSRSLFLFVFLAFAAIIAYFYIDYPIKSFIGDLSSLSNVIENEIQQIDEKERFNASGNDVIVFIHIQKTAGTTFEKFLVRYQNDLPCKCVAHKKRCDCSQNLRNETWLFSRYSTGWTCGLHADYTELVVNNCVERVLNKQYGQKDRRFFYTTFLRNPTERFISEFRHVQRGATWMASKHVCDGHSASLYELPSCFDPRIGWEGVSLEEFIGCPYNLAFNRQTRMLSNLSLVNCYEHIKNPSHEQDRIMLASAKENLRKMSFFGIMEQMDDSQFYFEQTFGIRFNRKMSVWGKSKSNDTVLTEAHIAFIQNVNKLDWELYEYAVELFNERINELRIKSNISTNL